MSTFQSTVIGRHYCASFSSLFFYPSLFPSLIPSYSLMLSSLLLSPYFCSLSLLFYAPCSFPLLCSYVMYVCRFLLDDFASTLYPIKRFVRIFLKKKTEYGTVPPDVFEIFQYPAIPIHNKSYFTKEKNKESVSQFCKRFHYFVQIPCERLLPTFIRPVHP
jgi:hypothetical protein